MSMSIYLGEDIEHCSSDPLFGFILCILAEVSLSQIEQIFSRQNVV